jgi:hypothetical protein
VPVIAGRGCLSCKVPSAKSEVQCLLLALADDGHLDGGARLHRADGTSEIACIDDRLAIDRDDHISRLDTGFGRGTIGLDFGNQSPTWLPEAERARDLGRDARIRRPTGTLGVCEFGGDICPGGGANATGGCPGGWTVAGGAT